MCKAVKEYMQKDPLYFPSSGREGSIEGERPGQPLKEDGELEVADQLPADTGAP